MDERRRCLRCEADVVVEYAHSARARRWVKAYFLIPLFLIPASPFLAGDYVVSIPIMMGYMLGIGPALAVIKDPPVCSTCGALVPAARLRAA